MTNKNTDFLVRLQEFIEDSESEHQRVQQELREIDLLIRQSTAEVERLSQRTSQMRTKVAAMETNLDDYARSEIKSIYNADRESQLRLAMIRNQVDQLQNKQRNMEKYVQELQRFLDLTQHLPSREELATQQSSLGEPRKSGAAGGFSMARVIEAQEDERFNLARLLHDGPAQSLSNLILNAEIVERLFDSDSSRARQELSNLKSFSNSTFQKVRDFIFELRPMMLDDLGLSPTLRRYVASFEERNGINVHYQLIGQEQRVIPAVEITLFRAVQELLSNAVRHAHATHLQVGLDMQSEKTILVVEDNGSGFDVNAALANRNREKQSVGLAALRERVETLGGDISFDSAVGRGTRVAISIPIEAAPTPQAAA
ncbi:MAG: ATP-binding protein [Ardenticatenales bacterium]|nr:ATP-binding protein [Ardenticatenales bacterium]